MTDANYDEGMAILEDDDRPTIRDYDEWQEKMAQVARNFGMAIRKIPAEDLEAIKIEADNQAWEWAWEFDVSQMPGLVEQIAIYLTVDDGIISSCLCNTFTGWFLEELKENTDNFIFDSLQYMVNTQAKWIRKTEKRREDTED